MINLRSSVQGMVLAFLLSQSVLAADGSQFRSLNDLPTRWTGIAGDLFSRGPAQMVWGKAVEVSRKGNDQSFLAEYTLTGELKLGALTHKIVGMQFWVQDSQYKRAELAIRLDDPLTPTVGGVVRWVESTRSFQLVEMPRSGLSDRRFVLEASEK
jgi:hypothetical protein